MKQEKFLLKDRIAQIEASFIKDGWVTIYESDSGEFSDQALVFCCLVDSKRMKTYEKDRNWVIGPGREGKPSIIGSQENGKWVERYYTHSEKGIEPFIYSRSFSHNSERYIDVSEEFVLYFNLFERGSDKQNRKYFFVDELGDLEEVIVVEPLKVKIKLRFLIEYISIRKLHFAICFDFARFENGSLADLGVEEMDKDFVTKSHCYNHYIRPLDFSHHSLQSWIHGKLFIRYSKAKLNSSIFGNESYEEFIVGYDDLGNELLKTCKKDSSNLFVVTYFKKEVLDKYYNDPKYEVDGWHVNCRFFSLKIDNHNEEYVAVFLTELGSIPYKEQLHWKQYNIHPQGGISQIYHSTMILGNWAEHSGTSDLFFKEKYKDFNQKWKARFGWEFYKPLASQDSHHFTSLHVPTTNNIKAFCEQILSLVKITIDSLNEKELGKNLSLESNDKGITKLERFLESRNVNVPAMMQFLRSLQDLRSGLVAHRFSSSNKNAQRALEYFEIKDDNLVEVANDIFVKSIYTMNTLENQFLAESQKG